MSTSDQLVVVTLNTWKGDGQYQARLELMSRAMEAARPDIVLLQECFVAPELGYDTAKSLAAALNFHYELWQGREKNRRCEGQDVLSTSGVAILSRYPLRSRKLVALPDDPRDGERAALFAEIAHPKVDLLVSSIHLTHLQHAEALRHSQFQTVVSELSTTPDNRLVLIGGDFNAPSDAAEFHNKETTSSPMLFDVRRLLGLPQRSTVADEHKCIDHIMMLSNRVSQSIELSDVTLICSEVDPVAKILPSDHFGLRAVFNLSRV